MTKSILALFLVASLAPAGAYAQRGAMLPPPEYDGLFTGDLTIKRLLTQNDVRAACPNAPSTPGPRSVALSSVTKVAKSTSSPTKPSKRSASPTRSRCATNSDTATDGSQIIAVPATSTRIRSRTS
jgi:hypothetical protein